MDLIEIRKKGLELCCIAILLISIGLQTVHAFSENNNELEYEYVNIKDMAQVKIANKEENTNILNVLMTGISKEEIKEVELPSLLKESSLPTIKSVAEPAVPKQVWHLPTEVGRVSQNPSYWHTAYDITSWRGTGEPIFPIANGVVSGIYTDNAGALVVTVLHEVDGKKYTSQYAHLSRYAKDLYLGKPVTINDSLGQMGSTGYSTGVHLHIAVLDCALFDSNDPNCPDLNGFFHYGKTRISQGFIGLGSVVNVPGEWTGR